MALRDNLVSWWELEEASGTRVDSHGSNDLTDNNTVGSATGIQGNGADFESSTNERLGISDASQTGLDITNAISISYWFKMESAVNSNPINKWYTPTNQRQYRIESSQGVLTFQFTSTGSEVAAGTLQYAPGGTIFSLGTWYHAVVTRNGANMNMYIDGTEVASRTDAMTNDIYSGNREFTLGGLEQVANMYDGMLDEVGIWSRALSASEVSALHNSGAGLSYAATAAAAANAVKSVNGVSNV